MENINIKELVENAKKAWNKMDKDGDNVMPNLPWVCTFRSPSTGLCANKAFDIFRDPHT